MNINQIRAANVAAGFHFFSSDTMRYFGSRVLSTVYGGRFFVTSERQPPFSNYRTGEVERYERGYTVREAFPDGSVETVGEFQQYATARQAQRAAAKAASA